MEKKHTKAKIKNTFSSYINELIISCQHGQAIKQVPVKAISQNNFARLISLTSRVQNLKTTIDDLFQSILTDAERHRNRIQNHILPKYKKDESSFREFQSLKKRYSVEEFIAKSDAEMYEGYYDNVEAILWYEEFEYLYVIKDGMNWEYESFATSTKKYICFFGDNSFYESNDLVKVEKALFYDYLKH